MLRWLLLELDRAILVLLLDARLRGLVVTYMFSYTLACRTMRTHSQPKAGERTLGGVSHDGRRQELSRRRVDGVVDDTDGLSDGGDAQSALVMDVGRSS